MQQREPDTIRQN
jgi:adenylate kinase family enzyme